MISHNFVYLGIFISFVGGLSYLRETISGKVSPNRISWFMWALAPLVAFAAQLNKGVGAESLLTFIAGFNPLIIFIGSFVNKKAIWKLTKFDLFCGFFSLMGLILWLLTREGNVAIALSIAADGIAAIPTIRKSFSHPETENYHGFLGGMVASGLTLLSIDTWKFENFGFSLYIFLICGLFTFLIAIRPKLKTLKI